MVVAVLIVQHSAGEGSRQESERSVFSLCPSDYLFNPSVFTWHIDWVRMNYSLYVHSSIFTSSEEQLYGCKRKRSHSPVSSESLTVVARTVLINISLGQMVNSMSCVSGLSALKVPVSFHLPRFYLSCATSRFCEASSDLLLSCPLPPCRLHVPC